jgi:hypothetical protein
MRLNQNMIRMEEVIRLDGKWLCVLLAHYAWLFGLNRLVLN